MKYYDTSFFCAKGEGPKAHTTVNGKGPWSIALFINASAFDTYCTPRIIFHLESIEDLLQLKYSLVEAIENAQKELAESNKDQNNV